jgi:hypothetical protein
VCGDMGEEKRKRKRKRRNRWRYGFFWGTVCIFGRIYSFGVRGGYRALLSRGRLPKFLRVPRSLVEFEAARFNADLEAMVSQISDTEKIRMMDE